LTFKKGNTFGKNPGGRKAVIPALLGVPTMSKENVRRLVLKYLQMTPAEMGEKLHDPNTTMLEHMMMAVIQKAMKEGDEKRINFLLDRSIGKVATVDDTPELEARKREILEAIPSHKIVKLLREHPIEK